MPFAARYLCLFMLMMTAFAATAGAGTIRDDRDQQFHLSLATQSKYASVGRLNSQGDAEGVVASGVLIDPYYLLTSAHTVDHAQRVVFNIGGSSFEAERWVVHPAWTSDLAKGYDLAVVQLSSPVLNVAPAIRYTGSAELGMTATAVGFGKTGTGVTGATSFDGSKRAGTNVIDAYYGTATKNHRILVADFDSPHSAGASSLGSSSPTHLEYEIGPGDSGSGLFAETSIGTRLIGINSFGAATDGNNDGDYGDTFGATRISLFNSWINSIMVNLLPGSKGGWLGSGADHAWLMPTSLNLEQLDAEALSSISLAVPEPATGLLLALGAICVLLTRRAMLREESV
jgi:secreted trypsin-like serine protease